MLDATLRPLIDPPLDWIARRLARTEISADAVTLTGLAMGLLSVPALAAHAYLIGLLAIAGSRVLDGLDGALARRRGPTDRGAFLDVVADFIFYAAVPLGFALANPAANALAATFLLFAFMGTAASFLAFAIAASKRGLVTEVRGRKGFFYLGGLTEGTETIAVFLLACIIPAWFPVLAWMYGAACLITTIWRIRHAWTALADPVEASTAAQPGDPTALTGSREA